jgi:hypothetical protein
MPGRRVNSLAELADARADGSQLDDQTVLLIGRHAEG